jgi:hypothetical protein
VFSCAAVIVAMFGLVYSRRHRPGAGGGAAREAGDGPA